MSPRIINENEYQRMPWRNGLGFTSLIAMHPPESSLATASFDWRLELSDIERNVEFSSFPEHERTFTVAHGDGAFLTIDGAAPTTLTRSSNPFWFDGKSRTHCALTDGKVTAFNVIVRRGAYSAIVQRLTSNSEVVASRSSVIMLAYCAAGSGQISHDRTGISLTIGQSILFDPPALGSNYEFTSVPNLSSEYVVLVTQIIQSDPQGSYGLLG